jgi:HYDIN/CFA65/VesB-like, Ig-like domain/Cep192 domain 4
MGRVLRRTCWVLVCVLAACGDRRTTVSVDGALELAPQALDFQQVAVHDQKSLPVTLRNSGRGRLDLTGVTVQAASGGTFRFSVPGQSAILPGQTVQGEVVFQPAAAGTSSGTLLVTTDSAASPQATVGLRGEGVNSFAAVKETTLDFGKIELQAEKLKQLTFTNSSALPVDVSARIIGSFSDEFSMASFTLQPGQTQTQDVSFHPQRVGVKRAALAITPCKGCGDVLVTLTGEGLEQALIADPATVDFGLVPTDFTAIGAAVLKNLSTEPVTVSAAAFKAGSDPDFQSGGTPMPLVIAGGATATVDLKYVSTHLGAATGSLVLTENSIRHPTLEIPLTGVGGGAKLCVAPLLLEFGKHAVGTRTDSQVTVRNCGGPGDVFTVNSATLLSGAGSQFQLGPVAYPVTLTTGASLVIPVSYVPTTSGDVVEQLQIVTSLAGGTVNVQLQSTAAASAPCSLQVTPSAIDFGTVVPGSQSLLGAKVLNAGADVCILQSLSLTDTGGNTFSLPAGSLVALSMAPGEYFTFEVQFTAPGTGGAFNGMVTVNGTSQPPISLPLTATAGTTCLVANPGYVDFGIASPACPAGTRQIAVTNGCTTPVTINSAVIGAGSTDGEFIFALAPPVPQTLAPGAGLTLDVEYLAAVPGLNLSPLFIDNSLFTPPLLVSLVGEASATAKQTDTFIEGTPGQVDVLFVVDNTTSMLEENPRLVAAMPSFASSALGTGVDLHVGVTTTGISPTGATCPGGASGGEAGRLFPVDNSSPRIFTNGTPNLGQALQKAVQVGECGFEQQGLEAMRRALTPPLVDHADDPRTPQPNDGNLGFYRQTASLAVVVVSDDDDTSPDAVDTYVRFLQQLKGAGAGGRAAVYAIVPSGETCPSASGQGLRYAEAASRTGGAIESVCAPDFGPLLQDVVGRAFSAQVRFPLSGTPDASGVTVTVDGTPATGWVYEPVSNTVVFASPPPPGSTIQVTYTRSCT